MSVGSQAQAAARKHDPIPFRLSKLRATPACVWKDKAEGPRVPRHPHDSPMVRDAENLSGNRMKKITRSLVMVLQLGL